MINRFFLFYTYFHKNPQLIRLYFNKQFHNFYKEYVYHQSEPDFHNNHITHFLLHQ